MGATANFQQESDTLTRRSNATPSASTLLGRKGSLEVRLSRDPDDVAAAQSLRYRVFYEELNARASAETLIWRRDADAFDAICDHLLVLQTENGDTSSDAIRIGDAQVVGTYRLLRQEVAQRNAGFYTQDEFDIATLVGSKPALKFLELGRSCVLKPYRTKPVVELLWQGIWNYVRLHQLDVMLGCASLEGTDLDALRLPLKFLHDEFSAPAEWYVRAQPDRYVPMDSPGLPPVDPRQAMRSLPPLIKGYLRLGAYIGDGAVVDHQFNTVDVLIILPVTSINNRYFSHFGAPDDLQLPTS